MLCAVHDKACSIVCRTTLGHTFADLRLVCSCRELSTNQADHNRQPRPSNTHASHFAIQHSSAIPAPLLTPQRHLYPTYEGRVHKISSAESLAEPGEDDHMGDAKSATSTTSSGKRKRAAGPAFYAVRVGRTPGVYYSWADCEAQVRGTGTKAECELLHQQITYQEAKDSRQEIRFSYRRRSFLKRHAQDYNQAWEV